MAACFMEPGSDATQDLSLWTGSSGTVASDTAQKCTGPRSIKLATAGVTDAVIYKGGILADAGRRINFQFRTDAIPAADSLMCLIVTSGSTAVFAIYLTHAMSLTWIASGATAAGGLQTLAINTWYRISVCFKVNSSTSFRMTGFVNGIKDTDLNSVGTLAATGCDQLNIQCSATAGTCNFWIDDIYVDDVDDCTDPGDIHVTNKRPIANGLTNDFSIQAGSSGSGYGTGHAPQVNEQPLSATNGWLGSVSSPTTEEYNIERPAVGDVDLSGASVRDVMGWVMAAASSDETVQVIVNGTLHPASVLAASGAMMIMKQEASGYPVGAGQDVGLVSDATTAFVAVYECGILVAYVKSIPPAIVGPSYQKFPKPVLRRAA